MPSFPKTSSLALKRTIVSVSSFFGKTKIHVGRAFLHWWAESALSKSSAFYFVLYFLLCSPLTPKKAFAAQAKRPFKVPFNQCCKGTSCQGRKANLQPITGCACRSFTLYICILNSSLMIIYIHISIDIACSWRRKSQSAVSLWKTTLCLLLLCLDPSLLCLTLSRNANIIFHNKRLNFLFKSFFNSFFR